MNMNLIFTGQSGPVRTRTYFKYRLSDEMKEQIVKELEEEYTKEGLDKWIVELKPIEITLTKKNDT